MKRILLILYSLVSVLTLTAQKSDKTAYSYLRGVECYEEGNYADAGDYFLQALKENEENGYAYCYIGLLASNNGYNGVALSSYARALKYIPSQDREFLAFLHRHRADAYWAIDDTLKTMQEVEQAVKLDPKKAEYVFIHGMLQWNCKNLDAAKQDMLRALALDSTYALFYFYLPDVALAQKDWNEALRLATKGVQADSANYSAYCVRSKANYHLGNIRQAARDLALAMHFYDGCYSDALAFGDTLAKKNYTLVNEAVEEVCKQYGGESKLLLLLETMAGGTNRFQSAQNYSLKILKQDSDPLSQFNYAYTFLTIGDYEGALREMEKSWQADSTYDENARQYGQVLQSLGRYNESLAFYHRAIANEPNGMEGYYQRAFSYLYLGNLDAALDDALHAVTIAEKNVYANFLTGCIYSMKGEMQAAEKYLLYTANNDTIASESQTRALALCYLGRYDEAKAWTEVCLREVNKQVACGEMAQRNVQPYYYAACVYALCGDTQTALRYLRQAFEDGYRCFAALRADPDLKALRALPEFDQLIEEYKQKPAHWE